jgi:hypothetical protein
MAVRAKFQVLGVDAEKGEVSLSTVVSSDPESENAQFFAATPNGQIQLRIVKPEVVAQFENGKEYYVDFIPVNEQLTIA